MEGSGLTQAIAQPASCYQLSIPFPNLYLDFPKWSFKMNLVFDSVSRYKHFDCKILYFTAISYCQKISRPIFIWHLIKKLSHLSSTDNTTDPRNQRICTLACEVQFNNDLRALKDFRSSQQYSTTYGLILVTFYILKSCCHSFPDLADFHCWTENSSCKKILQSVTATLL